MARSQHSDLACSFCGKSRDEVLKLISGPTVYICDECVGLCNDIIEDDEKIPALAELNAMSLLDFLRQFMSGRAVDSITVSELRDAIATERAKRLPRPPQTTTAPSMEPARRCELTEAQAALLQAAEARIGRGERGGAVIETLRHGQISDGELTAFLSRQYGVPSIDLDSFEIDPEITTLVPEELQRRHVLVPVNHAGASLIIAMADPSNIFAIDDLKFVTNMNVEAVVASEAQIRRKHDKYFPRPH